MSLLIAPLETLTDTRLSDPERRVLLSLYSFRNKNADTVWPSIDSIATRSQIKDKTRISKLTSSLADKGWLTKKKKGFTGGNEYRLSVPSNLDCSTNMDDATNLDHETYSNLDQKANLEEETKLERSTSSNLDCNTNSNLDSAANCNEQQSEQQREHKNTFVETGVSPREGKPKILNFNAPPPCPHLEIISLYHEILPELQGIVVSLWTPDTPRYKHLQARWREAKSHQSLEFWKRFFMALRQERWYLGENDRGWRANLEWIVKKNNFIKLVEKFIARKSG